MDPFLFRIDRSKDNALYYWVPFLGWFYRWRLSLVMGLLGDREVGRVLDVGYGYGVLAQRLSPVATTVVGVDHHTYHAHVHQRLTRKGIRFLPVRADAFALPFPAGAFDTVVCVSVLEHLAPLTSAVAELARVVRPGGVVVAAFPPKSRLTAACFKLIGFDDARFHPNDERAILAALSARFLVDRVVTRPRRAPLFVVARCWNGRGHGS